MFRLASYKEFKNTSSAEEFVAKMEQETYSEEFLTECRDYLERFGARGFMEIDVATKRTWEDISVVFDKLKEINTEESQITGTDERRQASYERLLAVAREQGFEKKFVKLATQMRETFGYREHPKYVIVQVLGQLHKMLLEVGDEFVKGGRLDEPYQVFDLHLSEIGAGRSDASWT